MSTLRAAGRARQTGFTLIEMLVALTIAGVLASMAAPGFKELIVSTRLSNYASSLMSSAMVARAEAIKRNAVVTMCVSSNGTSCGTGGWEQGWLVMCRSTDLAYCDPAGAGTLVIQAQGPIAGGYKATEAAGQAAIAFDPSGSSAAAALLTLCRATPSVVTKQRQVRISATGRPQLSKTTASTCG